MEIVTLQPTTINREMFNAALLAMASPYIVGVLDAENNAGNQAHDRYTGEGDIAEYNEGYTGTRRMMAVAGLTAHAVATTRHRRALRPPTMPTCGPTTTPGPRAAIVPRGLWPANAKGDER